jgi:hypothetical protein
MNNAELAVGVVDTFLPNSVETLESLAGNAAMVAHQHRMRALSLRGAAGADGAWQAAARYEAIADRFRFIIASEPTAEY